MTKMTTINQEEEVTRLVEEMNITISEMEKDKTYHNIFDELENNRWLLERVLGSDQQMLLVVYIQGSIQFNWKSQYQLALAVLLARKFPDLITDIELNTYSTSPVDAMVMKELGCNVVSVTDTSRVVEKPTIFLMLNPIYEYIEKLFEANWSQSRLSKMILLTNSLEDMVDSMKEVGRRRDYVESVFKRTIELGIYYNFEDFQHPFHIMSWHFFDFCSHIDMEALLIETKLTIEKEKSEENSKSEEDEEDEEAESQEGEVESEEEEQEEQDSENSDREEDEELQSEKGEDDIRRSMRVREEIAAMPFEGYKPCYDEYGGDWSDIFKLYRCPQIINRRSWCTPYTGWVKLNFHGKGSGGGNQASYGGIFHNEHKDCLSYYNGCLGDADSTVASIEALRLGLKHFQEHLPCVTKLVIEGDDVSVFRWANRSTPPPEELRDSFDEIKEMLKKLDGCVIWLINKEANAMAVELQRNELPTFTQKGLCV